MVTGGQQGWMRGEVVIMMARLRQESGLYRQSRDHRMSVRAGTQRHRGDDCMYMCTCGKII